MPTAGKWWRQVERRSNPSTISLRDLAWVIGVATAVILIVLIVFAAANGLLSPKPYARVLINNETRADLVAEITTRAETQAFGIPAGGRRWLPRGDYTEIVFFGPECQRVAVEQHGGPTAWQIVTVSDGAVTVEYPATEPTLLGEASSTRACP